MSLVNKYIMVSNEEYFKLFHVVDEQLDIGGYIVYPIAIENDKLYGGYKGVKPKEVLGVPELIDAENIYIFDELDSLLEWQKWMEKPSEEIVNTPKLNVLSFNKIPRETE